MNPEMKQNVVLIDNSLMYVIIIVIINTNSHTAAAAPDIDRRAGTRGPGHAATHTRLTDRNCRGRRTDDDGRRRRVFGLPQLVLDSDVEHDGYNEKTDNDIDTSWDAEQGAAGERHRSTESLQ